MFMLRKELLTEGLKIADQIASMPPLSIQLTKKVLMRGQNLDMEQACLLESEAFALSFLPLIKTRV